MDQTPGKFTLKDFFWWNIQPLSYMLPNWRSVFTACARIFALRKTSGFKPTLHISWWFGTFGLFVHFIYGIIIPIDWWLSFHDIATCRFRQPPPLPATWTGQESNHGATWASGPGSFARRKWGFEQGKIHGTSFGYGSIPIDTFLVGWTSIYQLFWCSPGVQGFDTLPFLVGALEPWNGLWLSICWEFHNPNWRSHIFQRGRSTTNQLCKWEVFQQAMLEYRRVKST